MRLKRLGCALLSGLLAFGTFCTVGCGGKENIVRDGKTVNVRVLKAGYGDEFIYELKDAFEAAYEEEGYKLNILTPASDMRGTQALQEMARGNAKTGVDLYIIGDIRATQVGQDGDYGILAEDVRDIVYNKKAIAYDGTEESQTVAEKLKPGVEQYLVDKHNVMYGFNWAQSSAGLVVNTRKLAKYGITELPRTTVEMFDIFEKIYMGANGVDNSAKSSTYPVTYVSGMNGYTACAFWTWYAQLDPVGFQQFFSMKNADGTDMLEDGYKVFKSDSLQNILTLAYRAMDTKIASRGSTTQGLDQAQASIMKDKNDAVFMFNGDWMLNEVKLNYRNYVNDIAFINTPLNSAIGEKIFCAEPYNLSAVDADKLLSYIAGLVDESKTIAEIISLVKSEKGIDLSEADANTIATARGTVFARGIEHLAYITKDSPMKDISALVLRMMASSDFARTFVECSNTATPYAKPSDISDTIKYEFVKQAFSISTNPYYTSITSFMSGIRQLVVPTQLPGVSHIASTIYQGNVSIYDGNGGKIEDATLKVYEDAATKMMNDAYSFAVDNWDNWIKTKLN